MGFCIDRLEDGRFLGRQRRMLNAGRSPGLSGLPLFLGWYAAGRITMTVMTIDLNFPSAAEKFLREVADYRGFSPAARLEALFQLSSLCDSIRAASPHLKKQTKGELPQPLRGR